MKDNDNYLRSFDPFSYSLSDSRHEDAIVRADAHPDTRTEFGDQQFNQIRT
jgi:hypothetical protein